MTKTAAPALVISTKAQRSGEISRPYGTVSMEQETLPPLSAPASAGYKPWADRLSERSYNLKSAHFISMLRQDKLN